MTFGYSRPPSPLPCSGLRLKPPEQQPALQAEVTLFFPGLLAALDITPKILECQFQPTQNRLAFFVLNSKIISQA
jgi:hypothetical protein